MGHLACTENATFAELSEGDITVEITGPLAPYEFEFYINQTTGYVPGSIGYQFRIQFEFKSTLLGDNRGNK